MNRICDKCKIELQESLIQDHHLHPKFMNNPAGIGRKVWLCKKCHNILHLIIPSILWRFIPLDRRQEAIKGVIKFTERWIEKN